MHNRYSTDEAVETVRQLEKGRVSWKNLFFGGSEVERRRALKDFSLRLPFRPIFRFIYMYIFLRGFLDGQAGLAWCTLQTFYEYLILIKVWEMKNIPVPLLTSATDTNSAKLEIERQG